MRPFLYLSLSALSVLSGCAPEQEQVPLPELNATFYQDHVHPIARFSCASLECHGVDGRALRLYAEDGLRAQAALRGQDLSADEVAANVAAFAGIDPMLAGVPELVSAHIALTKPLNVDAGGLSHVSGDVEVWADTNDPAYRCMRGWLAGDLSVAAACDEAALALDPRP